MRFSQYHFGISLQVCSKDQSQILIGRPWNSLRHYSSFSAIWDLEFSKLHYQIFMPTSTCHNFVLKHPNETFLVTFWSLIWCQHITRRMGSKSLMRQMPNWVEHGKLELKKSPWSEIWTSLILITSQITTRFGPKHV